MAAAAAGAGVAILCAHSMSFCWDFVHAVSLVIFCAATRVPVRTYSLFIASRCSFFTYLRAGEAAAAAEVQHQVGSAFAPRGKAMTEWQASTACPRAEGQPACNRSSLMPMRVRGPRNSRARLARQRAGTRRRPGSICAAQKAQGDNQRHRLLLRD